MAENNNDSKEVILNTGTDNTGMELSPQAREMILEHDTDGKFDEICKYNPSSWPIMVRSDDIMLDVAKELGNNFFAEPQNFDGENILSIQSIPADEIPIIGTVESGYDAEKIIDTIHPVDIERDTPFVSETDMPDFTKFLDDYHVPYFTDNKEKVCNADIINATTLISHSEYISDLAGEAYEGFELNIAYDSLDCEEKHFYINSTNFDPNGDEGEYQHVIGRYDNFEDAMDSYKENCADLMERAGIDSDTIKKYIDSCDQPENNNDSADEKEEVYSPYSVAAISGYDFDGDGSQTVTDDPEDEKDWDEDDFDENDDDWGDYDPV